MGGYRYEIHAHTSEVSKCSKIDAKNLVRFYHQQGYSGLCITDHFLTGNTVVPKDIPWEERIKEFCSGYEIASDEGQALGIDVFFGFEHSFSGTDFLTYGLDKQWLLEHPEVTGLNPNEYCDLIHEHGGYIIHAHPFREASYIDMIRLLPRKVDAVEVINSSMTDFTNELADQYADNYSLSKAAGSDNHSGYKERLCEMRFENKMRNIEDLIEAIIHSKGELLLYDCTP